VKKETLSVGFADLDKFTTLITVIGWEKTLALLQESFNSIGNLIVNHNGRIRKYLGDGILFTFADPRQAIRAAKEIAQYRQSFDSHLLRYYVAIATGEVFVGELGHSSLKIEDIMGEPVIQAFRLISEAKKSEQGLALCSATQKFE
jgi:adenylate cyclase